MLSTEDFTTEFETFRAPLKSFILRMTASVQDAEDIVQETYIRALKGIRGFRGESTLKTWVFAIASNQARDLLRAQKRWPENVTDICKDAALSDPVFFQESLEIRQTSPQGQFEIKEHIALCFTCVSRSLPLEQQLAVFLKEVYGFKLREIAEILESNEALVKYYLREGRATMIDVFDRRCSLINKEGVCYQCTELNQIYNPKQDAQAELVRIRMVRDAKKADKQRLFELRMKILRELDPFSSPASELQLHHLEQNREVMNSHSG